MTKKELIVKVLKDMGFKPHEDDDGDVAFRYQMKNIFAVVGDELCHAAANYSEAENCYLSHLFFLSMKNLKRPSLHSKKRTYS